MRACASSPADRREGNGRSLDDFSAAQRAGLREVAEETGQRLDGDELVWLSQWTPMQQLPRRFRTWFMLAQAVTDSVTLSPEEHSNYAWLSPVDALERHAQGKLTLVPPTWVTLHGGGCARGREIHPLTGLQHPAVAARRAHVARRCSVSAAERHRDSECTWCPPPIDHGESALEI